jgi:hypothetical protein
MAQACLMVQQQQQLEQIQRRTQALLRTLL